MPQSGAGGQNVFYGAFTLIREDPYLQKTYVYPPKVPFGQVFDLTIKLLATLPLVHYPATNNLRVNLRHFKNKRAP